MTKMFLNTFLDSFPYISISSEKYDRAKKKRNRNKKSAAGIVKHSFSSNS